MHKKWLAQIYKDMHTSRDDKPWWQWDWVCLENGEQEIEMRREAFFSLAKHKHYKDFLINSYLNSHRCLYIQASSGASWHTLYTEHLNIPPVIWKTTKCNPMIFFSGDKNDHSTFISSSEKKIYTHFCFLLNFHSCRRWLAYLIVPYCNAILFYNSIKFKITWKILIYLYRCRSVICKTFHV